MQVVKKNCSSDFFDLPMTFLATSLAPIFLSEVYKLYGTPKSIMIRSLSVISRKRSFVSMGRHSPPRVHVTHKLMDRLK